MSTPELAGTYLTVPGSERRAQSGEGPKLNMQQVYAHASLQASNLPTSEPADLLHPPAPSTFRVPTQQSGTPTPENQSCAILSPCSSRAAGVHQALRDLWGPRLPASLWHHGQTRIRQGLTRVYKGMTRIRWALHRVFRCTTPVWASQLQAWRARAWGGCWDHQSAHAQCRARAQRFVASRGGDS
ncbi:hypothetical protein M8818_003435 [Zalaria obscura]|uniref:Uncharacterized protein n=1 Tax=Zalaria obscura TaxID=2024903 RepID=A0ACC3SF71_9PEZI